MVVLLFVASCRKHLVRLTIFHALAALIEFHKHRCTTSPRKTAKTHTSIRNGVAWGLVQRLLLQLHPEPRYRGVFIVFFAVLTSRTVVSLAMKLPTPCPPVPLNMTESLLSVRFVLRTLVSTSSRSFGPNALFHVKSSTMNFNQRPTTGTQHGNYEEIRTKIRSFLPRDA